MKFKTVKDCWFRRDFMDDAYYVSVQGENRGGEKRVAVRGERKKRIKEKIVRKKGRKRGRKSKRKKEDKRKRKTR